MTPGRQAIHACALALVCALTALSGHARAEGEVVMPSPPAAPEVPVVAPVTPVLVAPLPRAPAAKAMKHSATAAPALAAAPPAAAPPAAAQPAPAVAPPIAVAAPAPPAAVVAGPSPLAVPPPAVAAPVSLTAPAASAPGAWLAKRGAAQKPLTRDSGVPSSGRLVGLALVLLALGAAVLYFKRRGRAERPKALPQKLTVLSSVRIAPKAHAVVLMVSGRKLLLGVTDSSVRRLAFIDEEEENEEEARELAPRLRREAASPRRTTVVSPRVQVPVDVSPSARSFGDVLKGAFKKREPLKGAAELLAEETQDSFTASAPAKAAPAVVQMVDVEGQAKGLLARLSGPRG